MFNRYSRGYGGGYGRGGWYQAFFWIFVGFLIGQVFRLDIGVAPRSEQSRELLPVHQIQIAKGEN